VLTHQGEITWIVGVLMWLVEDLPRPQPDLGVSIGNSGCAECCRDQRMLGGQQNLGRFWF